MSRLVEPEQRGSSPTNVGTRARGYERQDNVLAKVTDLPSTAVSAAEPHA
jgi:hypothetical protein